MPELPEVETIKNDLEPLVVGRAFRLVTVADTTAVAEPSPSTFVRGLEGQRVAGIGRRGKFLIMRLENGSSLIVHLRMTGNLLVSETGHSLPEKLAGARVRAVFDLDDGSKLSFIDRRRMGRLWLVGDEREVVGKLGPEPLSGDFTAATLAALLAKHRAPVKAVLCDQSVVAGIGNMYADEALFQAEVHPLAPANELSRRAVERLHAAIRQTLSAAIANKGASVDTYFRPNGKKGAAHYEFKVAHRLGGTCPACGGRVQRIKLRGRGTYFCPRCQRLPRRRPTSL